jgi:hypothetical protein
VQAKGVCSLQKQGFIKPINGYSGRT